MAACPTQDMIIRGMSGIMVGSGDPAVSAALVGEVISVVDPGCYVSWPLRVPQFFHPQSATPAWCCTSLGGAINVCPYWPDS